MISEIYDKVLRKDHNLFSLHEGIKGAWHNIGWQQKFFVEGVLSEHNEKSLFICIKAFKRFWGWLSVFLANCLRKIQTQLKFSNDSKLLLSSLQSLFYCLGFLKDYKQRKDLRYNLFRTWL